MYRAKSILLLTKFRDCIQIYLKQIKLGILNVLCNGENMLLGKTSFHIIIIIVKN